MATRDTALKVRIKDITGGELKKGESEWDTILLTPLKEEAGRVRVLATVVSRFIREDGKYAVLTLDDATDTITLRAFDGDVALLEWASEGDIVDVVGRAAEYQDELYINVETVSKITDPNWELVRKLELALKVKELGGDTDIPGEPVQEEPSGEDPKSIVKRVIEEGDEGDGTKYLQIIEESGLGEEKVEEILSELMEDGQIYEPKIGKFKRV